MTQTVPISIPGQSCETCVRVAKGQGFCEYFGFPLSLAFHQCSIRVFIYTLLLPEKQADKDGEPYEQQWSFENRGS